MTKTDDKVMAAIKRRAARFRDRKCDWDSPSDVLKFRKDQAAKRRTVILDRHVKDRVCPNCNHTFLESSRWAVVKLATGRFIVTCRSCCLSRKASHGLSPVKIDACFELEMRYSFEYRVLIFYRGAFPQNVVARECGWSKARQNKIESGNVLSLSRTAADKLCKALSVDLLVLFKEIERFRSLPQLKECRRYLGISLNRFASVCNWSASRQRDIENGCSVTAKVAKQISSKLEALQK